MSLEGVGELAPRLMLARESVAFYTRRIDRTEEIIESVVSALECTRFFIAAMASLFHGATP